jgi:hypothetical protein
VSEHKNDQEGFPDRAESIQMRQCRGEGDDRENPPANAGDDAVRLAASSKISEAIRAKCCEVQATGIQARWTDCAADEKTATAIGIAQQPLSTGAVKPTYLSMARSHELLGADGAGAHAPPTHVHCSSQEFTVRWAIADENRPRILRPAPGYASLAGTYSRMTMPPLNALVSVNARTLRSTPFANSLLPFPRMIGCSMNR